MNNTSAVALDLCGRVIPPGDPFLKPDHPIRLVEGICFPFFLVICTVGNTLNILVLRNNRPKSTADIYMISLALSDLAILWLYIPTWVQRIQPAILTTNPDFLMFDKTYRGLYPGFMTIFYFISNWIVVVFSLERLLVVSKPMYFLGRFNVKTTTFAVLAIISIGIIKSLQVFLDYFFFQTTGKLSMYWNDIRAAKYPWLANWYPVQAVATVVDPILVFCFLIAINAILVHRLIKRHKTCKQDLQSGQGKSDSGNYMNTVVLSMGCAFLFLVCKLPSFVYNALLLATRPPFCTYRISNFAGPHWLAFVWLFSTINYSVNFYLYCAISKKFREQLKAQFPGLTSSMRRLRSRFRRTRGPGVPAAAQFSLPRTDSTNVP
ncbi:hypothetical protein BV898_00621 [Hypsibius exemplaris]|uniref:G-protein coupled receptors family 1 profile domain-containing protein n=1 Tax=Hypsibius exemplaris TaxID=2072580 RepID=A0A1W0XDZ1_HYPEX|nr:hypothetical protein BV898_00621 [Hypsibius exemplaris]